VDRSYQIFLKDRKFNGNLNIILKINFDVFYLKWYYLLNETTKGFIMISINNFRDLKQFEASPVAFEMKYPKDLTNVCGIVSYMQKHWAGGDEHYEISTFHKKNEQRNFIELYDTIKYNNESVNIKMRKLRPSDAEKLVRTGNEACYFGGLCDLRKLASRHFGILQFIFGNKNDTSIIKHLPKEFVMDIARISDAL
jgi:hypothetical protein